MVHEGLTMMNVVTTDINYDINSYILLLIHIQEPYTRGSQTTLLSFLYINVNQS